jgi:hypothetical protein
MVESISRTATARHVLIRLLGLGGSCESLHCASTACGSITPLLLRDSSCALNYFDTRLVWRFMSGACYYAYAVSEDILGKWGFFD